ncbi:MAG: PaaI family thioesterase [Brevundimonas sp.]|nr:MAG: PaaI family thioesterase [Brevundimonas sp.]
MSSSPLIPLLPQLASAAAHTHALGFVYEGLDGDRVRLRVPWREDLVGDPETGVLAGGLVTTLLDHVGGLAVWVALDRFEGIATLDLRVDYMRPAEPRRDLIAEARCYRLTRSIAFVRAWAFEDEPANPVAAAQGSYMLAGEVK